MSYCIGGVLELSGEELCIQARLSHRPANSTCNSMQQLYLNCNVYSSI